MQIQTSALQVLYAVVQTWNVQTWPSKQLKIKVCFLQMSLGPAIDRKPPKAVIERDDPKLWELVSQYMSNKWVLTKLMSNVSLILVRIILHRLWECCWCTYWMLSLITYLHTHKNSLKPFPAFIIGINTKDCTKFLWSPPLYVMSFLFQNAIYTYAQKYIISNSITNTCMAEMSLTLTLYKCTCI